jgi:lipopolysaccharide transport protein LptA
MANFPARFFVCALALGSSALAAQDGARPAEELVLDMQSFEIDNKTNLVNLHGPRITQGAMSIAADEAFATGIDFEAQSEWRFSGNVHITLESAVVTSDSAVFSFDDKRLARGELVGQATFSDAQPDHEEPARGGANKIVYDYTQRTLRLTENAWVQSEGVQAQGCDIVYNLTTEGLASGPSDCADRFQLRFLPKKGDNEAAASPQ